MDRKVLAELLKSMLGEHVEFDFEGSRITIAKIDQEVHYVCGDEADNLRFDDGDVVVYLE